MSALVYLWTVQRRNALLRFLRRFRRPRELPRALLPLLAIGFIGYAVTRSAQDGGAPEAATAGLLAATLAAYLLVAFFGGFSDRGIAFDAADVDFLFPGPFRRSSLVLYHLASTYARSWVLVLLFFAFFGLRTESPGLALVGIALALATGEHLRVAAALLSIRLAEKTVEHLRAPIRALTFAAVVLLFLVLAPTLAGRSGVSGGISRVLGSDWARIAFYPAVAAADLATSRTAAEALGPLAGLLVVAGGTLLVLLGLQVHFLESSIVTSQKRATMLAKARQGRGITVAASQRPAARVRLPSWPVFRGAGSILWRNLVVARRSGRALVFTSVFTLLFLVPAYLGQRPINAVIAGALLPVFLSGTLAFDFRGETDHMARLKCLPVSPFRLALAEVAGSTLVALFFQALLLAALLAFAGLSPLDAVAALAAYVPISAGLLGTANLSHLLSPKSPILTLLLMLAFVAADLAFLAAFALFLKLLGLSTTASFLPLFAAQVAVTALVVRLLGSAFRRYDVAREA